MSVVQYHYLYTGPSYLSYSYILLMPITIETLSNLLSLKLISTSYLFHQWLRDGMLSALIQMAWTLYIISNMHYSDNLLFLSTKHVVLSACITVLIMSFLLVFVHVFKIHTSKLFSCNQCLVLHKFFSVKKKKIVGHETTQWRVRCYKFTVLRDF